jgi:hypothetical protein
VGNVGDIFSRIPNLFVSDALGRLEAVQGASFASALVWCKSEKRLLIRRNDGLERPRDNVAVRADPARDRPEPVEVLNGSSI